MYTLLLIITWGALGFALYRIGQTIAMLYKLNKQLTRGRKDDN